MAAKYRKIDPYIWNDSKFRSLSAKGQLAFLFVLTHQHMTAIGAMRGTLAGLASEHKDLDVKAFREALAKGMLKVDEKACFLWAPKFLKYNPPESPNVVKAWEKALILLPECQLKKHLITDVIQYLKAFKKGFREALPEVFREALSKSIGIQEQEQEQEQDIKTKAKNLVLTPYGFDQFWEAYPIKKAKVRVTNTWEKLRKAGRLPELNEILRAIVAQVAEKQALQAAGEFCPEWKHPNTWLNGGCWADEVCQPAGSGENGAELIQRARARLRHDGEVVARRFCKEHGIEFSAIEEAA